MLPFLGKTATGLGSRLHRFRWALSRQINRVVSYYNRSVVSLAWDVNSIRISYAVEMDRLICTSWRHIMNQPISPVSTPTAKTDISPPRQDAAPALLARGSPLAWLRFVLIACGGLTADLWTKHLAFAKLGYGPGSRIVVLIPPDILRLRTTLNPGAVFGVGQGLAPLFILISLVAIGFVVYVFMNTQRGQWVMQIALGLILAGAMGNLYDRAFNDGKVRDFILLQYWPWIFNLADAMLCIGVPLLIVCWLFQGSQMHQSRPETHG